MKIFVTLFVTLCTLTLEVLCGKVLVICPAAPASHKNAFEPIYSGLAERGHEVTLVTSIKSTNSVKNIRQVIPFEKFDLFPNTNAMEVRKQGNWGLLFFNHTSVLGYCESVYDSKEFMELLQQKFDLVLIDAYFHNCLLGFVHQLGAPFILMSPLPVMSPVALVIGNRLPPSFVRETLLHYSHSMTFLQRMANAVLNFLFYFALTRSYTESESVYRKRLDKNLPGVDEILQNASMIFSNSHFSFNFPRPNLPDLIEIGGAHCRPGKPLAKELQDFADGAKDGLILFSLGSIVKPEAMPEETRRAFVNVFSRLKQRVLWKWPEEMPDLPKNVKLSKWIPQQDVLAHPNTRLFITHSGLLSTQEAMYHGVPMVAIPVFGDQNSNSFTVTEAGIAETMEIIGLKEEMIEQTVNKVLNTKSYTENIKLMSSYFRDQLDTPKDRGIYWADYVMRHKGAHHMRSAARRLNFFQYHCLDVLAAILGTTLAILTILFLFLRRMARNLLRLICGRESEQKKKL